MFGRISAALGSSGDCRACFGTVGSIPELLASTKYYDPLSGQCHDQNNDHKNNLIFSTRDAGIPKTWIFNPAHCGLETKIDLAKAEEEWVLSQLAYASSDLTEKLSMSDC